MNHAYEKSARLGPSASTYTSFYQHNRPKTVAEFCVSPSQDNILLKAKANLFASHLLRLWVPIQENEYSNFLPNYQPVNHYAPKRVLKEETLGRNAQSCQNTDPKIIHQYYVQKKPAYPVVT